LAHLVLRPMRPRHQARTSRPYLIPLVGLLVPLGLFQWFCGFYVTPPAESGRGTTAIVWRTSREPFFNSPGNPASAGAPGSRVLVAGLPFWGWAYRQSLTAEQRAQARQQEAIVVGPTPPEVAPAEPQAGVAPAAAGSPKGAEAKASPGKAGGTSKAAAKPARTPAPKAAARPAPAAQAAAKPSTTPRPAASARPAASPKSVAQPAAAGSPAAVQQVEREQRLERLRREMDRIRRETQPGNASGARAQ
jgi:hypothetical protein